VAVLLALAYALPCDDVLVRRSARRWASQALSVSAQGVGAQAREPRDLRDIVWRNLDIVIQSAGPHDRMVSAV
jgi:hypothetical protein